MNNAEAFEECSRLLDSVNDGSGVSGETTIAVIHAIGERVNAMRLAAPMNDPLQGVCWQTVVLCGKIEARIRANMANPQFNDEPQEAETGPAAPAPRGEVEFERSALRRFTDRLRRRIRMR